MGKRKKIDLSDDYIRVRMKNPEDFDISSFETVVIDKDSGIEAVMGIKDGLRIIQSFLFDIDKWSEQDVKGWIAEYQNGKNVFAAELLGKKRTIINASAGLCTHKPNLYNNDIVYATKESIASLNDKYYFYSEGVHEGPNLNNDYFFKEELASNYKSAALQLIDFEHERDNIIGFTLDSELINNNEEDSLSLGFNGVLNRMSPFMSSERDGVTIDNYIKQAFFEGKLAVSMECLFDKIRCTKCGYETDDFLDFEFHKLERHPNEEDVYRGLVGVDFIGFGVTLNPADVNAEVNYLRTNEDGTLGDIYNEAEVGKFASACAFDNPDLNYCKASKIEVKKDEKKEKNRTKKEKKSDKEIEQAYKGDVIMYNFDEYKTKVKNFNELMIVAHKVLAEVKGNEELNEKQVDAFINELSDNVKEFITKTDFEMGTLFTKTDQDVRDAIATTQEEWKKKVELETTTANISLKEKDEEITKLSNKVEEFATKIEDMKRTEEEHEVEAKIRTFIDSISESGLALSETMEKNIGKLAKDIIDDDKALEDLRNDFIATAKKSVLDDGSQVMGNRSAGGDNESSFKTLGEELKSIRDNNKKE